MYFSTSFSDIKATPLHCQIPISMVRQTFLPTILSLMVVMGKDVDSIYYFFQLIKFTRSSLLFMEQPNAIYYLLFQDSKQGGLGFLEDTPAHCSTNLRRVDKKRAIT